MSLKASSGSEVIEVGLELPGFFDTTLQSRGVQRGTALWLRQLFQIVRGLAQHGARTISWRVQYHLVDFPKSSIILAQVFYPCHSHQDSGQNFNLSKYETSLMTYIYFFSQKIFGRVSQMQLQFTHPLPHNFLNVGNPLEDFIQSHICLQELISHIHSSLKFTFLVPDFSWPSG